MRSTLFYIPAEAFGVPVFGFGWLLLIWSVIGVAAGLWHMRRPEGRRDIAAYLPFFLIVAAVIAFVLPSIVEVDAGGKSLGLPIRGYGVMLMLATIAGVGVAAYRASQVGIDPEVIYSLAFVMFIAGIVGARLFFIVQYWDEFSPRSTGSLAATLAAIANVPKGGLVVYGSVIFGVPAGIWFCRRRGLPVLAIGDIIAPSMLVGQALGRVGCFLNGCCFGAVCLHSDLAVTFPASSPPYLQHEHYGWHSGAWLSDDNTDRAVVAYVDPAGAAASAGLKPGDEIESVNGALVKSPAQARQKLSVGGTAFEVKTADGRVLRWLAGTGPRRSVPVHATQLYAAIDAGLLALVLWLYFPFRRHDGEIFAVMLTIHPMSRFLLEMIRSDEPGQFGTSLTISQWISLALLLCGVAMWIYLERQPRRSALATART